MSGSARNESQSHPQGAMPGLPRETVSHESGFSQGKVAVRDANFPYGD